MKSISLVFAAALALALGPVEPARAEAAKTVPGATPPPTQTTIALPDGPKTGGGGRITIDKPTIDVGDVVRGTPGNAVFEIKNTGTDVLKILSAKPG
jgi:hypothetical protein